MRNAKPKIQAIFSINTGRSGSAYLATMLSEASNCVSHHEPAPDGFGPALQAYNRGDAAAMTDVARAKAVQIQEAAGKGLIYAETNHCFVKGFGWPLMEIIDPTSVGIVILRRDPEKIAQSMFRLGTSALSFAGQKYYLTPDRRNPIITPPPFFGVPGRLGYQIARGVSRRLQRTRKSLGFSTKQGMPFQRYQHASIRWYIHEMAALEHLFREKYPHASYYEIDIEMLNDATQLQQLCNYFELEIDSANIEGLGNPVNLKR